MILLQQGGEGWGKRGNEETHVHDSDLTSLSLPQSVKLQSQQCPAAMDLSGRQTKVLFSTSC